MNTRDEPAPEPDDISIDNRHERRKEAALERRHGIELHPTPGSPHTMTVRGSAKSMTTFAMMLGASATNLEYAPGSYRERVKPGPTKEKRAARKRVKAARKANRGFYIVEVMILIAVVIIIAAAIYSAAIGCDEWISKPVEICVEETPGVTRCWTQYEAVCASEVFNGHFH